MTLTPPRLITFLLSLILVGLAVASMYTKIPNIGGFVAGHRTWILVAAYAVLALGVVARGL